MDQITITGLSVVTQIGAHQWEQQIKQRLLIDINIPTHFESISDSLAEALDYDKLCTLATEYVEQHSFQLIETVANQLASFLKNEFKLNALTVTVHKPQAIKNAQSISVTATR